MSETSSQATARAESDELNTCEVPLSLGEALPVEMARVRAVASFYRSTIPNGHFAATIMDYDLDTAARALAEGDIKVMVAVYLALKGWTL